MSISFCSVRGEVTTYPGAWENGTVSESGEQSFYDEIGGMPVIERVVARFYEGVATDELLRPMYPEEDLADGSAARRLTLFLAQYWGGPSTYSQERGHPRLRMRHAPFAVTPTAGQHWLRHFRAGLDEVGLTPEQDAKFWGYVTYAAQFMLNTEEPQPAE
jgi:hemoglobin